MKNFADKCSMLKDQVLQIIDKEKNGNKKRFFATALEAISSVHHSSAGEVMSDLIKIHSMFETSRRVDGLLYKRPSDEEEGVSFIVKIFLHYSDKFILSDILKILDDFRIRVKNHMSHIMHLDDSILIHEFEIESINSAFEAERLSFVSENFFRTFEYVITKKWVCSAFNKLSIISSMNLDNIRILTAIKKYLKYTSKRYDQDLMISLTISNPEIFVQFSELFHMRLKPDLENREESIEIKKHTIRDLLDKITNLNEIRLLKDFYEVLLAILRTNFYQSKNSIVLKIKPSMISYMVGIQPYVTLFMFSTDYEGVHLRGSKVSRGGIRVSDRIDFPVEVLGLMRAQNKKNTIIIPLGAKGGFYIVDREKAKDKKFIVECYKDFISSILDVTDNLDEKNAVVRPANIVIPCDLPEEILNDESYDPYIVVAADKGTGSFSNYANELSEEYGFWMGDAFASGGSNGYDHKELAITSRGAFITVEQLFGELGKNIDETEFTVLGIGDMIGDVFGNGMLLSKKIRLVVAFNHAHIFLDPNPDVESSYKERKRLFALPVSSWEDYDKTIISQGGGVFSRNLKEIKISNEISKLLDIPANIEALAPDDLIQYALKAKIDLLWNGGIGTFVKSSVESHEEVADRANDTIRVNGNELRFKVVAEGGNLGFTQLGRVEAARTGVKINTDFIDNSGGVSCSDKEVNIKIALFKSLRSGKLSLEERNNLLESMKDEVSNLVLKDNILQNNALMLEESYKFAGFDKHTSLLAYLEKLGILNRVSEYLPNEQQIEKMRSLKQYFTRPELAILLTYTKLWLKQEILRGDLPDNDYFQKYLIGYFPEQMQESFRAEILEHPLRREIITNYITNTLINRVGINFISSVSSKTGKKPYQIIYAYIIIRDSYRLRDIWHGIEYQNELDTYEARTKLLLEVRHFTEMAVCWYLEHQDTGTIPNLTENIGSLGKNIDYLKANFESFMTKKSLSEYKTKVTAFIKRGFRKEFAEDFAKVNFLTFASSITLLSQKIGVELKQVAKLYFLVEEKLELRQIIKNIHSWHTHNMNQESAVNILLNNVAREHIRAVEQIVVESRDNRKLTEQQMIENWYEQKAEQIKSYKDLIAKIYFGGELDYSIVVMMLSRMEIINE